MIKAELVGGVVQISHSSRPRPAIPCAPDDFAAFLAEAKAGMLDHLGGACDEEFPATLEGGHALIIEFGDEQMSARCQCGHPLGDGRPDERIDKFSLPWERHVMSLWRGGDPDAFPDRGAAEAAL